MNVLPELEYMKTGSADLPLHGGKAPAWLFQRMEKLSGKISEVIIREYSREELLDRVSDPYWFQAFGCVLGFDWHSSGLTTTTMGAMKEALDLEQHGVAVAGGKGATSRKTPAELEADVKNTSMLENLKNGSRMSAAVDNSCVQDSYSLYHHTMLFTEDGDWAVVQQGMSEGYARRYHWRSTDEYLEDPHAAICSQKPRQETLDLSSKNSRETREISVDLVNDGPQHLLKYVNGQSSLADFGKRLEMPAHHELKNSDLSERSIQQLRNAYEIQPSNYEELMAVEGIGEKSLRALAMIAELVHGSESSWEDPAKYSYAHGGKDGTPYPVNRERYDESIQQLEHALKEVEGKEKRKALKRLSSFTTE